MQFYWKMANDPILLLFSANNIRSVLSGLSLSLFDSIQNKMSVRQSTIIPVHLIVKVICKPVCHQHTGDD